MQLDDSPVDRAGVEAMVAAATHRGPDGVGVRVVGSAGFGHLEFQVTPESAGESQPFTDASGRFLLVADARLDNRDELLAQLASQAPAIAPTDAELILSAFLSWGERCAERLVGDFVFAIWDRVERRLLLVRDRLGGRGLVWHCDGRRCLFASEVGQLLAWPGLAPRLDETTVAFYLASEPVDEERTFFRSIAYCPPAHAVVVGRDGARRRRYWEIDPRRRIRCRDGREYAERFLALLTASTRARMRSTGPIGLSLSGGLDSTLLAAVAARSLPEVRPQQPRLRSYSYVFEELASCDERRWIEPVVERLELDQTHLPCDGAWTLSEFGSWPVMPDTIWWDAYVRLPVAVAEAARDDGCRVLLDGQFGDPLFLGGSYWAAELMHDGRWGELLRSLCVNRSSIDWREDLIRHGLRQLVPQAWKRHLRRLRAASSVRPPVSRALHPQLAARTGLGDLRPPSGGDGRFDAPGQLVCLRPLPASFWTQSFAESRGFYNRFGLEVESPYHDQRLVEFVMALPADRLGVPWRDRRLQRDALEALGLDEVAERRGKTSFEPLLCRGLAEREEQAVLGLMRESLAVERGFVEARWLRDELAALSGGERRDATSLFDLWLCVALELWLRTPAVRCLP